VVSKSVAMSPPFRRFLDRLARDVRPERVVLFGSRARGTHRPTSDYDMLIVARRFHGVPWVQRAALAIRLWDLPVDLEPICLTPEEFRQRSKEISIVGVAAREGIVVFP